MSGGGRDPTRRRLDRIRRNRETAAIIRIALGTMAGLIVGVIFGVSMGSSAEATTFVVLAVLVICALVWALETLDSA
jgi:uncharacterized membrane protein YgaE (UPF0421/DUF939 family)